MAKNYEDRRLPERVYASASELSTQLNNGEPYGSYVKIAGELLSSLFHRLTQKQFEGDTGNAQECHALCALVDGVVSQLGDGDGISRSIRSGLLEQQSRCKNLFEGV